MGLICYVLRDYYNTSQIASLYGQYRQHMRSTNERGVRGDPPTIIDSYKWLERVPKKKRNARPLDEPMTNGSPSKGWSGVPFPDDRMPVRSNAYLP